MSLNDIQLPAEAIRELYRDNLVGAGEPSKNKNSTKKELGAEASGFKFLGKNLAGVAIIVEKPGIGFLPDDELNLLSKMLSACGLNLADVAIVNLAQQGTTLSTVEEKLAPSRLIILGVTETEKLSPLQPAAYQLQQYQSMTCFFAPGLQEMLGEKPSARSIKTSLWGALKQMFGL